MNPSRDLDDLLRQADAAALPGGDDFTRRLMARMRRRRRRRRLLLGMVAMFSALLACAFMTTVSLPVANPGTGTVRDLLAAMLLATVSAVAWIGTEGQGRRTLD